MTKHTPGPWTRVISRNQAATYTRVGAGDFGAIAECANMRPSAEENAANARLIAAAPELLAACQATIALLDKLTTHDFERGGDKPAREALSAAIARATGDA